MKNSFLACLLLIATSTANAALINIDFGQSTNYNGQGILGVDETQTWNYPSGTGQTDLLDKDGSNSGVDFTASFNGGNFNNPGNNLLSDRVIGAGTTAETITFSSLTADTAYDIVLYNGFYAQEYSVGGLSANTNPENDPYATDSYGSWTEGVEYAVLSSVMSDSLGELEITVTPYEGNIGETYSAIAGLQIQESAVPLPAAAYLFVTGLLGLAGIARRKKT